MQSTARTIDDYLDELNPKRRHAIATVRNVMVENLPQGMTEAMNWGMIASHKNHMALYLSGIYGNSELRAEFERVYRLSGLRMDMGKSCVRFRRLADLPLDLVAWAVGSMSMQGFIQMCDHSRSTLN